MWEGGLAPDSGVSATHVPLIHRHRGQAPSHSKFSVGLFLYLGRTRRLEGFEHLKHPFSCQRQRSNVGGGLLPIAVCQPPMCRCSTSMGGMPPPTVNSRWAYFFTWAAHA